VRDGLYHVDLGLPEHYRHPAAMVNVDYSGHALSEARRDRYGLIPCPTALDLSAMRTIEVEMSRGRVCKIVVRGPLDVTRDVVYVLIPRVGTAWFVKTVWVNVKSDRHRTLDKSRYVH
jgi:hypothetical protein